MTAQAGSAASPTSSTSLDVIDRRLIRQRMRLRRATLTVAERSAAARAIALHIDRALLLQPGKRIAVYLAVRGEVSLIPLIRKAHERRCELFVPLVTNFRQRHMEFSALRRRGSLRENRYGLLEPDKRTKRISARHLDIVFMPLVAFDTHGLRLGMGAGFYDRRFRFLKEISGWRHPKLIGTAYSFQQVPSLVPEVWDVPLDAVVTEKGVIRTLHLGGAND